MVSGRRDDVARPDSNRRERHSGKRRHKLLFLEAVCFFAHPSSGMRISEQDRLGFATLIMTGWERTVTSPPAQVGVGDLVPGYSPAGPRVGSLSSTRSGPWPCLLDHGGHRQVTPSVCCSMENDGRPWHEICWILLPIQVTLDMSDGLVGSTAGPSSVRKEDSPYGATPAATSTTPGPAAGSGVCHDAAPQCCRSHLSWQRQIT